MKNLAGDRDAGGGRPLPLLQVPPPSSCACLMRPPSVDLHKPARCAFAVITLVLVLLQAEDGAAHASYLEVSVIFALSFLDGCCHGLFLHDC